MPGHPLAPIQPPNVRAAPLNLTSVRDAQRALNILLEKNFLHAGPAFLEALRQDGVMGEKTAHAIVYFQQSVHLPVTGQFDPSTRGMLAQALRLFSVSADPGPDVPHLPPLPAHAGLPATPPGHPAGHAAPGTLHLASLAHVQRALNIMAQQGMIALAQPIAENDQLGSDTQIGLAAFQQSNGLPVTGQLDDQTRSQIVAWLATIGIPADAGLPPPGQPPAAPAPHGHPHPAAAPGAQPAPAPGGDGPMPIASVADVQAALNLLLSGGLVPLRAYLRETGVVDQPTSDALGIFQLHFSLPPTRTVDSATRNMVARLLNQIGVSAYAPQGGPRQHATGALPSATPALVDRSTQIRNEALRGLAELRSIGVNQVADSMRYLVNNAPTVDGLRSVVTNLSQPNAGTFANSVAALWKPALDWYGMQRDPNAAFQPSVQTQIAPLLSQLDTVLSALGQLAATPSVDNLNTTVARLSQTPGDIAHHMADTLRVVLAVITAPPSPAASAHV
jgi:peptidoglycan hydrolase-like protein with peptidoglycan-binding domain